jgi:cytochrome P450
MTTARHPDPSTVDPFTVGVRGLRETEPWHAALRAAGPIVEVAAPAGGSAWVVTEESLARRVLTDPRISKDTALAPAGWDRPEVGLEPPAAVATSLTTAEGCPHTRLRRAHAPLLSARRLAGHAGRIAATAHTLLGEAADAGATVDLMADFTVRYPLTVVLELVGVPLDALDEAVAACRGMVSGDPREQGRAFGALNAVCARALGSGVGVAAGLRERLGDELDDDQLAYLLFGLVFAGQLTTDAALGFLLAHALDPATTLPTSGTATDDERLDALVADVLREHPPAPFTLWRFATTEIELAGAVLPAGSPILVDVLGIDIAGPLAGPDLTFWAGPHFCVGVHLARLELRTVLAVLRDDFPHARLAVPFDELRQVDVSALQGSRLERLPVRLRG